MFFEKQAPTNMDLSLPSHAPKLDGYQDAVWDDASFPFYSLIETSKQKLQEIASTIEEQWMEDSNYEGSHLIRLAPNFNFAGKSLTDVVKAYIELDKERTPQADPPPTSGDIIAWYPIAFVVLVEEDWQNGGLMFVYADDEDEYALHKFTFLVEKEYSFLSSLLFGDISVKDTDVYAIENGSEGT